MQLLTPEEQSYVREGSSDAVQKERLLARTLQRTVLARYCANSQLRCVACATVLGSCALQHLTEQYLCEASCHARAASPNATTFCTDTVLKLLSHLPCALSVMHTENLNSPGRKQMGSQIRLYTSVLLTPAPCWVRSQHCLPHTVQIF